MGRVEFYNSKFIISLIGTVRELLKKLGVKNYLGEV